MAASRLPGEAFVPLYDYQCEAGHVYEKRESFGAPAHQPCDKCGKPAHRLLHAPPVVFKGSGWYVTDSQRSVRSGIGTVRDDSDSDSSDSSDAVDGAADAPAPKKRAPRASRAKKAAASDE